jgi:hypothetical protein
MEEPGATGDGWFWVQMMRANYQVFCDPQFWIFVEMHQSAGKLPDFPDHLLGGGVQGMG